MARIKRLGAAAACGVLGFGLSLSSAWAQKNSGPLLPVDPPVYRPAPTYTPPPAAYSPPAYIPAPPRPLPQASAPAGQNPDAERLAQTLPLDPQTRELQNQEPANPRAVERRLGLREPRGPATDMRGRTPSSREIVDALAPH